MIRATIIPENQDVSIHVPENYIGRQIEVLLYPLDELHKDQDSNKKKTSDFRGKLNLTNSQYTDFQNHLKDIRKEWDRDISRHECYNRLS